MSFIITKILINAMNATFHYKIVNTWGYANPKTGMYNGMTGQIQRKEVEIGATVLFMTPDRVSFLEYISMTTPTRAYFVFRAPPLSYVSNIYYLPFDGVVWICTMCLVALSGFVIYVTVQLPVFEEEKEKNSLTDIILMVVGSVCQMGSQLAPRIMSARISTVSDSFEINSILKIFLLTVLLLHCIDVYLYIIYCKYCCIIAIDYEINNNIERFTSFFVGTWSRRYTILSLLFSSINGANSSETLSNEDQCPESTIEICQRLLWYTANETRNVCVSYGSRNWIQ